MALPTSTALADRLLTAAQNARRLREEVAKRAALEAITDVDAGRRQTDIVPQQPLVGSPSQR